MKMNATRASRSLRTASLLACALLLVMAVTGAAADKKDKNQGRLLLGKVLDQQDNPVPNSVVYLTSSRTHAVKTYIIGPDGTYRFPGLSATVDYEVYAQYKNRKSDTKSVSQFDDRSQVYIDLKIDTR
ncbi:MAG: carboxypeptidase-like regulatory domain-containing protein [Candidatus Sulfotelmatobacter sp.]